ncbi:MAG: phage holin family protein [Verrucomicrobia bacterium]|nr:phage holin family protein [Verrucomicrobiota bacterium]
MFVIRLIIMAFVILGIAHCIPGIEVPSFWAAAFFALILGILNAIVRPLLLIFTLPITILTVGLFALIINALTFWMAGSLSFGVEVTSFSGAFWGGAIVWATSALLNRLQWSHAEMA